MSAREQQLHLPEVALPTPVAGEPEEFGAGFKFELEPCQGAGVRRIRGASCVVVEQACVSCVTCT